MKEQASALSEDTKGILVGEVNTQVSRQSSGEIVYSLDIIVPTLNAFRYSLLRVDQPITIYPLSILDQSTNSWVMGINNDEEFTKALSEILSSDQTSRIINALLSQARSSSAE